jgi:cell division inhibitor SulA
MAALNWASSSASLSRASIAAPSGVFSSWATPATIQAQRGEPVHAHLLLAGLLQLISAFDHLGDVMDDDVEPFDRMLDHIGR